MSPLRGLMFPALAGTANFILLLFALIFGVERLYINIDYFFPMVFLAYGMNFIAIILLLIFFSVDCIILISEVYPFIRLSALIGLARYAHLVPAYFMLATTVLIASFLLLVWAFKKVRKSEFNKKAALFWLSLVLLLTYIMNAHDRREESTWYGASG